MTIKIYSILFITECPQGVLHNNVSAHSNHKWLLCAKYTSLFSPHFSILYLHALRWISHSHNVLLWLVQLFCFGFFFLFLFILILGGRERVVQQNPLMDSNWFLYWTLKKNQEVYDWSVKQVLQLLRLNLCTLHTITWLQNNRRRIQILAVHLYNESCLLISYTEHFQASNSGSINSCPS